MIKLHISRWQFSVYRKEFETSIFGSVCTWKIRQSSDVCDCDVLGDSPCKEQKITAGVCGDASDAAVSGIVLYV